MATIYIPSESGWQQNDGMQYYIRLVVTQTYNSGTNTSSLSIMPQYKGSTGSLATYNGSYIKFDGSELTPSINGQSFQVNYASTWTDMRSSGYTLSVTHSADGSKSIAVSVYFAISGITAPRTWTNTGTLSLTGTPSYTLTIGSGTGYSISVKRNGTSLSNGATIYRNDSLVVSASASTGYRVTSLAINGVGVSNISGTSHTVTGSVSVTATASPSASSVGATDANIGSVSTITVTKNSASFYHSLQYSFGGLTGYITSSGGTQSSEAKISNTSIAFTVPTSFYVKIPNSKTGTCTITCKTYENASSSTVLGTSTCTFTATASAAACSPTVSGTVVDVNSNTTTLTGNTSKLIRYKSKARATISASAKNGATLSSKTVNGLSISTTRDFENTEISSYVFSATDSRGYTSTSTVNLTVIDYVQLSLNVNLWRSSPTDSNILLSFYGNFFNGNFGAASNTLTVQYRYCEQGSSSFNSWTTVSSNKYSISSRSYTSGSTAIDLGSNFPYDKSYVFQVRAYDGALGVTLSTASGEYVVQKGTPVFDWGGNDFNFNVPVSMPALFVNGNPVRNTLNLGEADAYIPQNGDYNDYVSPGAYSVRTNAIAGSLAHRPSDVAGTLRVWNATGNSNVPSDTWYYVIQEYTNIYGATWRRYGETGTGTTVVWRDWERFGANDSDTSYCKMPDGTLMCWGYKSYTIGGKTATQASRSRHWYIECVEDIQFPVGFISKPSLQVTRQGGQVAGVGWVSHDETKIKEIDFTFPAQPSLNSTDYADISWFAIGRWKA